MDKDETAKVREVADRVLELAEEVEAAGHATLEAPAVARAREALHRWVDGVKGVVINPALGRVTVIHENGRESTIASPDLPFAMSEPVNGRPDA